MTMDPNTPAPASVTSIQNETAAVTRHAVTFGSGILTFLGLLAFLPADQVTKGVALVQDIGTHAQALVGDIAALIPIITLGVGGFSAFRAKVAASLPGQLKSITSNPAVKIPQGSTIEVPPAVAAQVPSLQVVPPA